MARPTERSKTNQVSGTLQRKRLKPWLMAATLVTLILPVQGWWLCVPVHCVVTLEAAQALQLWFIIHFISSGNVCPPVTLIQPSALR